MRFAAFVVALLCVWVSALEQCSDSLGTCGVPQTSLMQLKSLSQKIQASTGRSASSRAQTLAGFQKYTQDLVDQFQRAELKISDEVLHAIEIINTYLDELYADLRLYHQKDATAAAHCGSASQRCLDEYLNTTKQAEIDSMDSQIDSLQQNLSMCLLDLDAACAEPACPNYLAYRKYNLAARAPGITRGGMSEISESQLWFVDSMALPYEESKHKHFMESIDAAKHQWIDPLYDQYTDCKDGEDELSGLVGTCHDKQKISEQATCNRNLEVNISCQSLKVCHEESVEACNDGVDGACAQIEINWKARQADNETAERIRCLLGALVAADEEKAEKLIICHNTTYEEMNADWVINCTVPSLVAPDFCSVPTGSFCSSLEDIFGGRPERPQDVTGACSPEGVAYREPCTECESGL